MFAIFLDKLLDVLKIYNNVLDKTKSFIFVCITLSRGKGKHSKLNPDRYENTPLLTISVHMQSQNIGNQQRNARDQIRSQQSCIHKIVDQWLVHLFL